MTFFDAILLIGFSELVNIGIFGNMKILVLISAFLLIDILMILLMFFSVVKGALSVYTDVKKLGGII